MEALPLELMRLIFGCCDPSSVRNLRTVNRFCADVGYDFLLGPKYTAVGWAVGIANIYNIAHHDRLRAYTQQLVLNLSDVDEKFAHRAAFLSHVAERGEELTKPMTCACRQYQSIYDRNRVDGQLSDQSSRLTGALCGLPSLQDLEIIFTQAPPHHSLRKETCDMPSCRKLDRQKAIDYLNTIIRALHGVRIKSLAVDWLPYELFRHPENRNHWFRSESSLENLRTLSLVLDTELTTDLPRTQAIAVNGLGRILRVCKKLASLSLAFRNMRKPRTKTVVWFSELIGDEYTFPKLSSLSLEGMSCGEGDLTEFLVRHAATLTRLRLGGRGLAKPHEQSTGGMQLCRGQWRCLFSALRKGMKCLERLHLEGDFSSLPRKSPRHEAYLFYPTTDEAWNHVDTQWRHEIQSTNSLQFESYVVRGGFYPGSP